MPSSEVMGKFKHGQLHSGSKTGPQVTSRKQAVAIMMSEKRAEKGNGGKYPEKKGVANTHGAGARFVKKGGAAPKKRPKMPPHTAVTSPGADHIRNASMRGMRKPY